MGHYRKKPVVIEAIQHTGRNYEEILKFSNYAVSKNLANEILCVDTLEGRMTADVNDWIIKGVKGEFYFCKPDIFAMTYEEIDE